MVGCLQNQNTSVYSVRYPFHTSRMGTISSVICVQGMFHSAYCPDMGTGYMSLCILYWHRCLRSESGQQHCQCTERVGNYPTRQLLPLSKQLIIRLISLETTRATHATQPAGRPETTAAEVSFHIKGSSDRLSVWGCAHDAVIGSAPVPGIVYCRDNRSYCSYARHVQTEGSKGRHSSLSGFSSVGLGAGSKL